MTMQEERDIETVRNENLMMEVETQKRTSTNKIFSEAFGMTYTDIAPILFRSHRLRQMYA